MKPIERIGMVLLPCWMAVSSAGVASTAHAQPADGSETPASAPASAGATPAQPRLPAAPIGFFIPRRSGISWDVEIEGGLRLLRSDDVDVSAVLGRLKLGVLLVREPMFVSVTATGELGGMASAGFGAEVQLTHSQAGLWGHLGVTWTGDDTAVVRTAVGLALFGLEWQRELDSSDTVGDALFVNLRVPVGIIYVLRAWTPKLPAAIALPRAEAHAPK